MTEGVEQFRHGHFEQRIDIQSEDEIGQLANAFNEMADTIVTNMDELKRNDRLRRRGVRPRGVVAGRGPGSR